MTEIDTANPEDGELSREGCIAYGINDCAGYYTPEQIAACWVQDTGDIEEDATEFFARYTRLKHEDEVPYYCLCGGSIVYAHPYFGVTFGFGPAGACTCDGKWDEARGPIPRESEK